MERFVVEFLIEYRCKACGMGYAATLDEHTLDDPVDFAANIADLLALLIFKALAESQKVVYCPWADVIKKFKNYYLSFLTVMEVHRSILTCFGVHNLFIQAVSSHCLPISECLRVTLFVVDQGPFSEVVPAADVLMVIKNYEGAVLVVIKFAL